MEHCYADVNGVKLHYASNGRGKLILFLHGFPEFWYAWKAQLEEFGQTHHAVAPDMRGYNLSAKPQAIEEYAVPVLVNDVAALAGRLLSRDPQEKFVLAGHDWGGGIAWAFALTYPERLEKLVIVNAPHPAIFARELRNNPKQQVASSYMLLFRSEQAEGVLSAGDCSLLAQAVFQGARPGAFSEEDRQAYREVWRQPGALTGGLNYYRAAKIGPIIGGAAEETLRFDLPRAAVKVPTLVIWGEQDTALLTGNLEGLEELVPDLRIRRIPDATHWVVHEYPELVNARIHEFLAE